jgi:hypothetical protein
VDHPLKLKATRYQLISGMAATTGPRYSSSNPWLSNFSVRLFSVTVRTT